MDHPSSSQVTCVLRLDTQTSGWDKSMHKLFKGIQDVKYTIDATRGLAYLSGKISPEIILRIRKAKKHAELIHMDYGHVNPPNPYEIVPISYHYPDPRPPPPPMFHPPYTYHRQYPYVEQPPPYYYYPYYAPEVMYSPPPQIPTRDGVTGESQCRIM